MGSPLIDGQADTMEAGWTPVSTPDASDQPPGKSSTSTPTNDLKTPDSVPSTSPSSKTRGNDSVSSVLSTVKPVRDYTMGEPDPGALELAEAILDNAPSDWKHGDPITMAMQYVTHLEDALAELVRLKFNRPPDYEERKPKAWEAARVLLIDGDADAR